MRALTELVVLTDVGWSVADVPTCTDRLTAVY